MSTIAEGLYIPTDLGKRARIWHRYVIGELNGMIRYSRGGDQQHHVCKASTFEGWIRRWKCVRGNLDGSGDLSPTSSTHAVGGNEP